MYTSSGRRYLALSGRHRRGTPPLPQADQSLPVIRLRVWDLSLDNCDMTTRKAMDERLSETVPHLIPLLHPLKYAVAELERDDDNFKWEAPCRRHEQGPRGCGTEDS